MKRWLFSALFLLAAAVAIGILHPGNQTVTRAAGSPVQLYLEYVPPAAGPEPMQLAGIPANCSSWHELYPAFCVSHHQDDYSDNGDGVVSPCDQIILDGRPWHIVSVGPTYWTTCYPPGGGPPTTVVFEPDNPQPGSPVCQTWHEIYPQFCNTIHVDSFHDGDNSGDLSVCDEIDVQTPIGPTFYHIDRIELDITVEPGPDTPTEKSTWGSIKSFFEKLMP